MVYNPGRTKIHASSLGPGFEEWMAKENPGVNYETTYGSRRNYIRNQWKEYQRQIALDKVRAAEYEGKWLSAKEFDKQTADNKLRVERYSTLKTFANNHGIKTKLNPDYKHGDQWGKYTSGKYLYEPVTPELVKKTKKSVLKGKGAWQGPIFDEEWQRRKDLGQKLIDESRKNLDKKKWIITQRDLNKALTKLTHPITGEKEVGFSDKVLGKGKTQGNLYPELTGEGWQKDPTYLEKNPKSAKTDAVLSRIRRRILNRISGSQTERALPAIKRSSPLSEVVHIMHTTSKGGEEYLTIEDLALGSKKQNLTYATRGPDGLDTLRNKMQLFLQRLKANHGHKGIDGEIKLDPRTVKQWNLPKSTWKLGELADRFNLGLSDMAMATDGQVRGNLLELETMKMVKNPFKGNLGKLIGAGTLGDITVKELDESLGKLELQSLNPKTGKVENPSLKYNPDGSLKFKNKFYLRDATGKLLTNPDGSIKWSLDPAKVTSTDVNRIHGVIRGIEESISGGVSEGKPISLSGLATKTQNPLFLDLAQRAIGLAKTNDGGICNINSIIAEKAGGGRIGFAAGSSCARQMEVAFSKNPLKVTQEISALPANKTINSLKTAAGGFLKILGRGGAKVAPLAALAAVGAAIEPLVKQFRNDDPSTYMTDIDQQKGVLLSLVEQETPTVDEEILKWQTPALAGATAAGAIPGAKTLFQERRGVGPRGPLPTGVGKTRAALGIKGVLGKALGASFSPLAVAATLPLSVAAQRSGGTDYGDIATDPMNWLGPAFASSGAEIASKGIKNPLLLKALRLGMSPGALRIGSRFLGLPGLALTAGMWGYDKWKNRDQDD